MILKYNKEFYILINKITLNFEEKEYIKNYLNSNTFNYFEAILYENIKWIYETNREINFFINYIDLNFSTLDFAFYRNKCDTFEYWEFLIFEATKETNKFIEKYKNKKI